LLRPARELPEVQVVAVAARDPQRAAAFAKKHDIPRVHPSYEELLADPGIEAIYNPLPNSHHCVWTIRALEAGKDVLCEKPVASNAREAKRMADTAEKTGRILVEAFHYRYHPLAARMQEILRSGELGTIRFVEASMCVPLLRPRDIRFNLALAGGAGTGRRGASRHRCWPPRCYASRPMCGATRARCASRTPSSPRSITA
jgi:predicted dehydrogenase